MSVITGWEILVITIGESGLGELKKEAVTSKSFNTGISGFRTALGSFKG